MPETKKGSGKFMKKTLRSGGRRVLAALLCLLMAMATLPLSAFAWTSEEGKRCTSLVGSQLIGSDGEPYRAPLEFHALFYNPDGSFHTISFQTEGHARTRYLLVDDSGSPRSAYCVEAGAPFGSGNPYVSENSDNSSYFRNLPMSAQFGIMLVLLYGWQEGKASPVPGTNEDDYIYATQTLIWEYQQQIRTSPTDLHDANGVAGGTYLATLEGRPARKCYDWMLTQMSRHYTVPSFASRNQNQADTHTLRYHPIMKKYSLTFTDTNNTLADIRFQTEGLTVSRSGNQYTFTSDRLISEPLLVSAQRAVANTDCRELLIWGSGGKQTMASGASDPVYFYFKIATEAEGIGRIRKISEDGVVSGIRFHVSGNGVEETVTTGADGTAEIRLVPGIYTVTEESRNQYEPQIAQTLTVISGQTSTVTFNNVLKRGSLKVTKTSEDGLVEGMKFHLYGTSCSGLPVDEYATTNAQGIATFQNVLVSGDTPYTLEEVETVSRYVVPVSQTAAVEWGKVTERSFHNVLKKFRVTVTKTDGETETPQGDGSLAGAVYGIYKGGELVDTYTTDGNGRFTTAYYACGEDWSIREVSPSEGYLLDEAIHPVGAEPELYTVERNTTKNNVTEQAVKGKIAIIKHTDDGETQIETPEAGAVFEVFLKSAGDYGAAKEPERDILTCDESGFAETKDMPYGVYTVRQTSGWEGRELMKPFDVFISQNGQTYRYLINNADFKSYVKIVKTDAETGKAIPYAGAGFQIYDPSGNLVTMTFTYPEVTAIDTFYTTEDGDLITPQKLPSGKGYSLVEVQAPYGYVLNPEPVSFDVVQEDSEEESGVTVIVVERSNLAQKGRIIVSKSGEVFHSVTESEGMYQPVFVVSGLEGAVYEITAAEDIVTPDETVRASKGEVVDTVTTDGDGMAKSKELYLGHYEVRETEAPFGYVRNEEILSVELVYAGQEIAVTETAADIYDERQKVEIDLVKRMEVNEAYGIGNGGELSHVTFGLYASEELAAADGTVIPTDGLLEILSLDEEGRGMAKTDLPFGSYYVKELSTADAYVIGETKYPVAFAYAGQDTAIVHLFANDGEAIENPIRYGSVKGRKLDEDGNNLEGAVIGIFPADSSEFTRETAIDTAVSGKDGGFSFEKVPYGTWVIREIESPEGFILSEREFSVDIGEAGEVVEIELVNEFIQGNLAVIKVDGDDPGQKLSGAVFEVYADTNQDGNLDSEDVLLGEMVEVESGVYRMDGLRYGDYLVREAEAPEGFVPDESVYAVSVRENGKTYAVENREGIGFANEARKGALKIVKTSDDRKVEGFSFRVTGVDGYEQTFQTDERGEILIEGLRIGEYTVSEVSDSVSAGYILPDDRVAKAQEDSVVIVQMHNKLRDVPETGDATDLTPWVVLAALSVIGAGIFGLIILNKKKKED